MSVKENIKCFVYYSIKDNQVKISEFSNPSQRDFLMYEANAIIKKVAKKQTKLLQSQPSSNGFWYYKVDKDSVQLVLSTKGTHQSIVDMMFAKASAFLSKTNIQDQQSLNKLKYNINDSLKFLNANSMNKLQHLNQNVDELSGIMKSNVGTIVKNMSDLETVERKSLTMSELSMTFENNSKLLEEKMKRRQFCIRMAFFGIILCVVGMVVYIIFG